MSDNKHYYYIKLKADYFDTDEMIVLESMTDGHKYSNILLKLYLKSLAKASVESITNNHPIEIKLLETENLEYDQICDYLDFKAIHPVLMGL